MSYLTNSAVKQLGPSNFGAYVEGILTSHRDAVFIELGISRFERPFFNSAESDLDKSLVLSKLYDASNGISPRPVLHQEDCTQIIRQLRARGSAGHSQNWKGLRFLDLSYARGGIGDTIWCTYEGVQGTGISQSQGDATHTSRLTASRSQNQLPIVNAEILRAAEKETFGTYYPCQWTSACTHPMFRE